MNSQGDQIYVYIYIHIFVDPNKTLPPCFPPLSAPDDHLKRVHRFSDGLFFLVMKLPVFWWLSNEDANVRFHYLFWGGQISLIHFWWDQT